MEAIQTTSALQDKVAVITDAGWGIGRAIAIAYAAAGARVVCGATSNGEIDETVELISQQGGRAIAVTMDVTYYASVESMYAKGATEFGGIDIVVINAGAAMERRTIEEAAPELWRRMIDVNLTGAFNTAPPVTRCADAQRAGSRPA